MQKSFHLSTHNTEPAKNEKTTFIRQKLACTKQGTCPQKREIYMVIKTIYNKLTEMIPVYMLSLSKPTVTE